MSVNNAAPRTTNVDQYPKAPSTAPNGGWTSFEHLRGALPDWTTPIEEIEPGIWVRYVPEPTGIRELRADGVEVVRVNREQRHVALSLQAANTLSHSGDRVVHHDFWDGWTWWRDGIKPERDMRIEESKSAMESTSYTLEPIAPGPPSAEKPKAGPRSAKE
jgi:hypothetical protein